MAVLKSLISEMEPGSSLRSRAMHSGVWIGAGFAVQKALQLGSNLILTRLLFPEAFGLMALANVFLIGMAMFSDIGLKPAVIRDPRGDDPQFLNTAWTIQVVRGLTLCVIGMMIAYPLSLIYRQPILFPLLAVLSITPAVSGFASIGLATAERRLDFRTTTIVQIAGQIASIGLLVTIAYFWRSVWALAVANVIGTVVTVAIGHVLLSGPKGGHGLMLDKEACKRLIQFGRWIFFSTVATFLGGEGLKSIQGGLLTPAEFGVLAVAYTIAAVPIELSTKLNASIGLPAFAEAYRDNPNKLTDVLRNFRKKVLIPSLFLVAIMVFSSKALIKILYDDRYHAAGVFVIALLISNSITLISTGYNNALLAMGKYRTYLSIMLFSASARIAALVPGFHFFGIFGMILGIGIANLLTLFIFWPVMHKSKILDLKLDSFMIAAIGSIGGLMMWLI